MKNKTKVSIIIIIVCIMLEPLPVLAFKNINNDQIKSIIISQPYLNLDMTNKNNEMIISYKLEDLSQTQIDTELGKFTKINIQDSSFTADEGKPQLPCIQKLIAVPSLSSVYLEIIETSIQEKQQNFGRIYPAQESQFDIFEEGETLVMDEAFYKSDIFYPSSIARIEYKGMLRDIPFLKVSFYPIQYNPKTEMATIYDSISVRINFDETLISVESNFDQTPFYNLYDSVFTNWNDFIENYLIHDDFRYGSYNMRTDPGCEYLIISHPNFLDAANNLANWKNKKGIITKVVDTTVTGNTAEEIRQYIQIAYDTWESSPSYVLLFGDVEYIPTNYYYEHPLLDIETGTDLWYTTVSGPPDDYFPDIFIGRISVDTTDQANTVVQKIINYETIPPSDPEFFCNVAIAAYFEDIGQPPEIPPDDYEDRMFIYTSEQIRDYLIINNFYVERIYYAEPYVNPLYYNNDIFGDGGELPDELLRENGFLWDGDATDVINTIQNGCLILNHRDHGSSRNSGYPYETFEGWGQPYFTTTDVDTLTNGDKLPIVFSINCNSGWFDGETDGYLSRNYESFCEEFIRKTNGGAIGAIGSSRYSGSGYNDYLCMGFYDAIWPDFDPELGSNMPLYSLGEILNYGKMYMTAKWPGPLERLTFELFHWFGDPTLEIWTDTPKNFVVDHPTILYDPRETTITVADQSGNCIEDALVCISQPNGINERFFTDNNGIVTADLSKINEEEISIVVTKHNFQPYMGMIRSIPLFVDDNAPNDPGPGNKYVSDPLEDGSFEHPFDSIPEAINVASEGRTIFVLNGTYYEYFGIDKSVQLIGEQKETTIIDGNNLGNSVLHIDVDNVEIRGFTIQNSGISYEGAGIKIYSSDNIIVGNIIQNNFYGVHLPFIYNNYNNQIYNNIFADNEINAYDHSYDNSWNREYPIGGNYWNDHDTHDEYYGPYQELEGPDGIVDQPDGGLNPYVSGWVTDNYPLSDPNSFNKIITVDDDFNEIEPGWQINKFDNIQDGINVVETNGLIFVYDGIYSSITITKDSIKIINVPGEEPVINGNEDDDVVWIAADNVSLKGFRIQNSGYENSGIKIRWCADYNDITGNTITDNYVAINLYKNFGEKPEYNNITNNVINNNEFGICLQESDYNIITQNTINNNVFSGIRLDFSKYNEIYGNNINNNQQSGIYIHRYSEQNVIKNNDIVGNGAHGIYFTGGASFNTVFENNLQFNNVGIYIDGDFTENNKIYHNTFVNNNIRNAHDTCNNIWNDSYPYGGNYWDDLSTYRDIFSGYEQNDPGSDGINDFSHGIYQHPSINIDYYPLIEPDIWGVLGDLDFDRDVDLIDLAELLGHYGMTSGAIYMNGDLDGDGDVDLSDLAEFLGNYGVVS